MPWRKEKRKDKLKQEGSSAGENFYNLSIAQACEKLNTSANNGKSIASLTLLAICRSLIRSP